MLNEYADIAIFIHTMKIKCFLIESIQHNEKKYPGIWPDFISKMEFGHFPFCSRILLLSLRSCLGVTVQTLKLTDQNRIFAPELNSKTMGQVLGIGDIKKLYPDVWVLLGNPIMDESNIHVLSGIPIFHSKDKKEVCYIGRNKTSAFDKITLVFTGTFKPTRKITRRITSRFIGTC